MLKAKLRKKDGVPALYINGKWQEAHMVYLSTPSRPEGEQYDLFIRTAKLAAASGVRIFTFHSVMDPDLTSKPEETNKWLRELMHRLIEAVPEALILPRCAFHPLLSNTHTPVEEACRFTDHRGMEYCHSSFEEYAADPTCLEREEDKAPFADFVSDYWRHQAMLILTRFIRACRADGDLGDHIIGYHFAAGMSSEHYQFRYWDGVLDVSECNQKGFRYWLYRKYRTDEALAAAWQQEITLADARVPEDIPGIRKQFKPEIREKARTDRRVFDTIEWYTWRSWDADLDFPDALEYSFRVWLTMLYPNDEALSRAWGGQYSLLDNLVPEDFKSWFIDFGYDALLCGKGWIRFSDYLDYYADQVASLVETASATIKRETAGDNITGFFYGYHYDVQSAQSGHHSLARVLACPDVDFLCAPVSYYNRNEGGMGASMADVSSIHDAGKLWIDESDYRQPVVTLTPNGLDVCKSIRSLAGAREIVARQCGRLALYRAATWWMDLRGLGWYDSAELWGYIKDARGWQMEMEQARRTAPADILFIDDEKGMSHIGDAWGFADDLMNKTRNEAYYSGLCCDYRMMEDFLSGRADGAKLYVFLNPFRLVRSGRYEAVLTKLRELGAPAVWMYGFSCEDDMAALKTLTGFDFTFKTGDKAVPLTIDGVTYTRRTGKTLVIPANGTVLGTYATGDAGYAYTEDAGYPSYFLGGTRAYTGVLRTLAKKHGARIYTGTEDMFQTLGNLAVLHTAAAGKKTVDFGGRKGRELRSGVTFEGKFTVDAPAYTTYLFITE